MAASASSIQTELGRIKVNISKHKYEQDESGTAREWWATREAHRLLCDIKAATYAQQAYEKQADKVDKMGPIRRVSNAMITTSKLGLGIEKAETGKRSRSEQSASRNSLVEAYDCARHDNPKKPEIVSFIWDIGTGQYLNKQLVTAAHLVPYCMRGDLLITYFGNNVKDELDTPLNGVILHIRLEAALDDGAIVIVPNVQNNPSEDEVKAWEAVEPKQYKWRVIDPEAEILQETLDASAVEGASRTVTTIASLDGRQLQFRNNIRPRARYLYFLFVVGILKFAWRQENRKEASKILGPQLGKGVWATHGCYLGKPFLLALAEEIGYGVREMVATASMPLEDDDDKPDETGILAMAYAWKK
ncbi:hypothetical protein F4677DRAFT_434448 [Hypoxylon crocopeplum]|nr:hypothetical protein F4677DRAFT_434448 [Hypoxylon crocopeplum]